MVFAVIAQINRLSLLLERQREVEMYPLILLSGFILFSKYV